jgi:hypothetical protein
MPEIMFLMLASILAPPAILFALAIFAERSP